METVKSIFFSKERSSSSSPPFKTSTTTTIELLPLSKEMSSSSSPAFKTTTNTPDGKEEVQMTNEEVKSSNGEIIIKQFGENSKDDRVIHFTMSPDHDCVNGVCSDGDFMLTDIPEFSKIHIHSMEGHDGIIAEEFNMGTTIDTYIGVTTESPSPPRSPIDDEDASNDATVNVG